MSTCLLLRLATSLLLGGAVVSAALPPVALIENQMPHGVIYLHPESSETARFAALELQNHLQLATGVTLKIVSSLPPEDARPAFLVGPSPVADSLGVSVPDLAPEEHLLHTVGNRLVLLGHDSPGRPFTSVTGGKTPRANGTLLAVYHYLEHEVGFRWFMPGPLGTHVPQLDRLDLPALAIRSTPAFHVREAQWVNAGRPLPHPEQWSPESPLGHWYLRSGLGRAVRTTFNHTFHFLTGGGWSTYSNDKNFRTEKPHIFAVLPDGSYDFETTSYGEGNLNLTEPDTLTEFVKLVRWRFDQFPELLEFTVAPNDVWQPCMSDASLARLPADLRQRIQREAVREERGGTVRFNLPPDLLDEFRAASHQGFIEFAVKVAREVQKTHPDRWVGILAGYLGGGPPETDLVFPSNFAVIMTKNRAMYWDEHYKQRIFDDLTAWRKITPNVHTWEYYLWKGRAWFGRPLLNDYPVLFSALLEEDMRFLKNIMKGEYSQNWNLVYPNPGLGHLMQYLTAKLLANPDLSTQDLLTDYYEKFYGAAAAEMRAFWELAETCWMRNTNALNPRSQAAEIIELLYPVEDVRRFHAYLQAAKGNVPPDSVEFQRIALIEEEMSAAWARITQTTDLTSRLPAEWAFRRSSAGLAESVSALPSALTTPDWQRIPVPATLSRTAVGTFAGYGWYATDFTVPDEFHGRDLRLSFEGVDEQAWVYVNGQLVGENTTESTGLSATELWDRAFSMDIPANLILTDTPNRLAIRLFSSVNEAGIWKPVTLLALPRRPVGPPVFASTAVFPAPAIDGEFPENWSDATTHFITPNGAPTAPPTSLRIAHDPQAIYLAWHAEENGLAPLPSEHDAGGWSWTHQGVPRARASGNTVEIQLQPDPSKPAYVSLLVNAGGRSVDAFIHHPDFEIPSQWQSGARVQTQVSPNGWTATVAIPWSSLGVSLSPGLEIKANFIRTRADVDVTAWSPFPANWTYDMKARRGRELFGTLAFPEQ